MPSRLLAVICCAVILLFATASPAAAHDELVATDPAADSTVAALPAAIELTFSAAVLTGAGATEIQVTDAAGTSLTDGDPVTDDTVVTQALAGEASGPVTVRWKVVSSDGHPISGELSFTVTPPAPTSTATTAPTATSASTPTATASPSPTTAPAASGAPAVPWIVLAAVGGIALAGGVVYLIASARRR